MPSAEAQKGPSTSSKTPSDHSASKPFSISLGSSKSKSANLPVPSHRLPHSRKRPHSSLNDSDSENEDRSQRDHQLVAAFDHAAGGAISVARSENTKEPLVIQGLKNRDWREESRRKRGKKNLLPHEVQQAGRKANGSINVNGGGGDAERNEVSTAAGLSLVPKAADEPDTDGDTGMAEGPVNVVWEERKIRTADEEALEALMGSDTKKSTLVVPAVVKAEDDSEDEFRSGRAGFNEDDHFRSDVASRPDMASLDDYARVPVEEFGLGMLRGMGWKEGEVVGKRKEQVSRARIVERRPALLGIGAKEVPGGIGEEVGAWGKVARGKKKLNQTYSPVMLKNSKTGEMLTEEELQAKKTEQDKAEKDWRERRDRNLAIDEDKKSQRRKRDRNGEREDEGQNDTRRERSRSRDSASRHSSSRRERSRSSDRRNGLSRRDGSRSREPRHHSTRRELDDVDQREKQRSSRKHSGGAPRWSGQEHDHRFRREYDHSRRRRHEVY
ncbi:MAG: hypothetical protein Q9174_000017 [Haloplaca sp. 1 TL-2023]